MGQAAADVANSVSIMTSQVAADVKILPRTKLTLRSRMPTKFHMLWTAGTSAIRCHLCFSPSLRMTE
jgi:hypothetical protein